MMAWRDLYSSTRRLITRRYFAASAVLLVGASVGIVVTMGTVVREVLVRALPYPEEDRLVFLYWSRPDPPIPDMSLSLRVTRELPDRTDAFEVLGATLTPVSATLRTREGPVHLRAGLATPESFEVLGFQPLLGRAFLPAEGEPGASVRVALLSHEAWRRFFGGRNDAVGSSLDIDGAEWSVVGVLPPERSLAPERAEPVDIWFPTGASEQVLGRDAFASPGAAWFRITGRLTEAAAAAPLSSELDRVAAGLAADYPTTHEGWRLNADRLRDRVNGSTDPILALGLGSALFWAIALLNLLALFVQSSEEDARDTAIRVALGASAGRIWRHRLSDALLIGAAGGVLAAATSWVGIAALRSANPLELPAHVALGFGWTQGLAIGLLSLAGAAAAAGIAGAAIDSSLTARLASGFCTAVGGRTRRTHAALALQVAVCTVLSVGAVSAARSLHELRSRDVGVEPVGVLSGRMEVTPGLLAPEEIARCSGDLVRAVRALPTVDDAFVWSPALPTEARTYTALRIESPTEPLEEEEAVARYHTTSPGAVTAFGLHVMLGRDLTSEDRDAGRRVALVSESAARAWWGAPERALGQNIQRTVHAEWSEVVGVVADAPMSGRFGPGSANTLDVYFMFDQDPRSTVLLFAVSPRRDLEVGALQRAVSTAFPQLPLYDVRWMRDRVREQERVHNSTAWLSGAYALAALLLAAIGLAGASALAAHRRRVEIGLRQALGASRRAVVLWLVLPGVAAAGAGLAAGSLVARWALGFVDPMVLTVGPADATSYAVSLSVLAVSVAVALAGPTLTSVRRPPAECLAAGGRSDPAE
jgi:putative ABC transport system permease protein